MKYIASRLSEGNKLFPAEVHIEDNGVTVKIPGFFSGDTRFIPFENISSVDINTPMIGFSSITFYCQGNQASAHGFKKDEAKQMKQSIDSGKARAKVITVKHITDGHFMPPQQANNIPQQQQTPPVSQTTIINKAPSFLTTAASALGGALNNVLNTDNEREETHRTQDKIQELAMLSLSSDKNELLNQLNYLVSLGISNPDSNIKNVIIEKLEFGIMKLKGQNANDEAAFFEKKLEPLKKKNPFDFLKK